MLDLKTNDVRILLKSNIIITTNYIISLETINKLKRLVRIQKRITDV